ncbi:MAG: hypothetical protein L3K18_09500 [Thermoplasmata archaeon]|nr:hypothetical protein [Thermoplasmata archaeon]
MPSSAKRTAIRKNIRAHALVSPAKGRIAPIQGADEERDRKADAIWEFFEEIFEATQDLQVTINRERIMEYLDAFRSQRFMDHIEESALPYELKVDLSQMVTGLSKAWPGVRDRVQSQSAERFAAMVYTMSEFLEQVVDALGISIVIPTEAREVPTPAPELPLEGGVLDGDEPEGRVLGDPPEDGDGAGTQPDE